MMESERLYDCIISYHLITGQVLAETYKNDVPKEVWMSIKEEFADCEAATELQQGEVNVLLPKSNVSYITMKVLTCT